MSIPKLPPYKQQLLDHLVGCGWELVVIEQPNEDDRHAFMGEQWTIRSVREMRGYELVLTFVSDFVSYRLIATTNRPIHHMDFEGQVASLRFDTGLYNETMLAFAGEINDHRDSLRSQDTL